MKKKRLLAIILTFVCICMINNIGIVYAEDDFSLEDLEIEDEWFDLEEATYEIVVNAEDKKNMQKENEEEEIISNEQITETEIGDLELDLVIPDEDYDDMNTEVEDFSNSDIDNEEIPIAFIDDAYETAIFPAPQIYLTQLAYETYSHGSQNGIDIAPGGNVFAPFSGTIVQRDSSWGFVLLQSNNKVHYADGSLDYMTVGFMHDSDISNLSVGQTIAQGTDFFQAGGMGNGNPNAYGAHVHLSVFRGKVNGISGYGNGNIFAFDAFYAYTARTRIVYPGKVYSGNVVNNGAPTDYNGLWKTIDGLIPSDNEPPVISDVKVYDVNRNGYSVSCKVTDNVGVSRVAFPTWTDLNGQDDLQNPWPEGVRNGDQFTFRVNISDHNNEVGNIYLTDIYAYDTSNNVATYYSVRRGFVHGSEMHSGYDRVLPDGDYLIAYAASPDKGNLHYLDIQGYDIPALNSTNVQLFQPERVDDIPECDIWTLKYNDGFYSITQKGSDQSLDVANSEIVNYANIQSYVFFNSIGQQWAISKNSRNGYRIQAKCSGLSLDIEGKQIMNRANIVQEISDDSDTQSWLFIPYHPSQPIENGRYILLTTMDEKMELDVPGDTGDVPNNINMELWNDGAYSQFNSFDVIKLSNGYYKFVHSASGLCLDVTNGVSSYPANVALHTDNSSIAQQWAIVRNGNGYKIISKCNGFTLDIQGKIAEDGANVCCMPLEDFYSQIWKFVPAEYTVTYQGNGGMVIPEDQTKYYKQQLKLNSITPTREGYQFLGWSLAENSKGVEYLPGDTYSKDENVVLYAVWESQNKITTGMLGDLNGDNDITIADIVLLNRHVLGKATLPSEKLIFADVNKDGDITIGDVVLLNRHLLGKVNIFL